jgi:uncharacterized protein YdhG (YjbR/CyaY superfamily)
MSRSKPARTKKFASRRPTRDSKVPAAEGVDAYIASHPPKVQTRLQQLRATIARLAPAASETISYGIPTFKLHGNLVHYAGYAHHVGFYPGGAGIAAFQKEIAGYKNAKGSVQFPHDRPLPLALVKKIVKYRVAQNEAQASEKAKTK